MDVHSSQELRARREALARTHARRRLTVVGVLLAVAIVAAVILRPSSPAGTPADPAVTAAAAPAPRTPVSPLDERAAADDTVIDSVLGYTPYIARGSRRSKEVALTFDDGPGPSTPALLRYLTANGVPATFFLVGEAIAERPNVVEREIRAGFSLGAHTQHHARLGALGAAEQSREILGAADRITRLTGHAVRLFRPPYGSFDAATLRVLRAHRMLMVLWSVDTRDYSARTVRPIVHMAISGSRAGSIVLLHDGPGRRPHTLKAVRRIVPALRRRGYRLVSLPELLRDEPPPRNQPAPRTLGG